MADTDPYVATGLTENSARLCQHKGSLFMPAPEHPLTLHLFLYLEVVVVDGKSGLPVWKQELPWQKQQLDALSVMTLDKKSVFLFWADEAQPVLHSLVSSHPFFTLSFL